MKMSSCCKACSEPPEASYTHIIIQCWRKYCMVYMIVTRKETLWHPRESLVQSWTFALRKRGQEWQNASIGNIGIGLDFRGRTNLFAQPKIYLANYNIHCIHNHEKTVPFLTWDHQISYFRYLIQWIFYSFTSFHASGDMFILHVLGQFKWHTWSFFF